MPYPSRSASLTSTATTSRSVSAPSEPTQAGESSRRVGLAGPVRPDQPVDTVEVFGFESRLKPVGFSPGRLGPTDSEHVPLLDPTYRFDQETTQAILAGFATNARVLVHGPHGSGKSTHIEQVASRLGWPCLRINLDGHITRLDLVGRDAIVVRDDSPVTEFQEGLLPWAIQRPVALVFDELDAARPEVMFVIQRLLERDGRFTLLDQNLVLTPHPSFRIFATANTIGLGDLTGLYHGTQVLNQAQLDRFGLVARLDYLAPDAEALVVAAKVPDLAADPRGSDFIDSMVALAGLTRTGFEAGDVSTMLSVRSVIAWAEAVATFGDLRRGFDLAFANRCDPAELAIVDEYYQRVFSH